MVKKEIRVLGIDDSPFDKFSKGEVLIVGVIMRGGSWVDGVISAQVKIDGRDATDKIISTIMKCKFKPQLQCIFLDGIAVAGLNVIDIKNIHKKTGIPVIVIIRKYPDLKKIKKLLERLNMRSKIELIEKAGDIVSIGKIFVQLAGIDKEMASEIIRIACTRSLIPEPLRLAHIIASGIAKGESKGRA